LIGKLGALAILSRMPELSRPSAPAPAHLSIDGLRALHVGPIALQAARGECIAILGPSGSGKSVFLRLVADLDSGEGRVVLDDIDRAALSGPEWRRRVIYQAAEPAWWGMGVAEHFPAGLDRDMLAGWIAELGLPRDVLQADIARLSTGERQRLALLRSLAHRPMVLLLDEPTASLDPATTLAVEALLAREQAAGLTLLWVTHSHEQAVRVAARHLELNAGRLQPAGSVA
jgi:ABC-type iron transport system FetAB ATPase subunit